MNNAFKYLTFILIFSAMLMSCKQDQSKESSEIIPLKDFFKNPEKSNYKISPDGKYLSFTSPYKKRMNLFVKKIGTDSVKQLSFVESRDIFSYIWANETTLLYLMDDGGDENDQVFSVNLDGSGSKALTPKGSKADISNRLPDEKDLVMIESNQRDPRSFDPYFLNISTGEMTLLATNPGGVSQWILDHDNVLRIGVQTDGINTNLLYRENNDSEFKTVLKTNFKESLSPLFFTFDNKFIYALSNLGRDKLAIIKYDIENGKELDVLYENNEYDLSYLFYSHKRKVITAASYTSWKRERHFFDKETEDMYSKLEKKLPKYEVVATSKDKEENIYTIRTYSDRSLGAYYLYNKSTDELKLIGEVSPWLDESKMASMKPIQYKSRDGLTIHGYLTVPINKEAKNLPVVVNPHGGPWARDSWTFDPSIQFLANRGYAVLQMNFRGSTGYGRSFWESSFKQWGQTMQNDITDGVKWAIDQGIADKDKIAIYGASYGGYATLAGLTYTPDLYACGIDYVGVSNLFTFMKSIPPYWQSYLEMLYEMVGHPEKDSAMLAKFSPSINADKIKAPLFIAQGAQDPRVVKAESDQMVEAMKKRGIDVQYMVKENEGHGFRNEENRFEFY